MLETQGTMDKHTTPSEKQSINQEACAWIVKLDSRDPSAEDRTALRQWMSQSPQHKAEIERLAKLWGQLNVLAELAVPHEKPQLDPIPRNRSPWVALFATAATVIISIGLLLQTGLLDRLLPGGSQVYVTAVGEQRRIPLQDGSTMLLNTNSRAEVDYTAETRQVRLLSGEAHFEVEHDTARPFLVYAGNGVVRAVGTAFSVYVRRDVVDVTVTEGTVELKTAARPSDPKPDEPDQAHKTPQEPGTGKQYTAPLTTALVRAGQRAKADGAIESIETVEKARLEREQSWRQGILRFSGDPLEKVIEEISRYTSQTIEIEDPALRSLRFGGVFTIGETEKMFAALESGFGVKVERVNENLVRLSTTTL